MSRPLILSVDPGIVNIGVAALDGISRAILQSDTLGVPESRPGQTQILIDLIIDWIMATRNRLADTHHVIAVIVEQQGFSRILFGQMAAVMAIDATMAVQDVRVRIGPSCIHKASIIRYFGMGIDLPKDPTERYWENKRRSSEKVQKLYASAFDSHQSEAILQAYLWSVLYL
jgi:hypothetical protein